MHFPGAPLLVLSATMTNYVRHFVASSLKLHRPTRLLKMSIDRPNVYLTGHQLRHPLHTFKDLEFVIEGEIIPKTMIFCDNCDEGCEMVTHIRSWIPREVLAVNPDLILEYTTAITVQRRNYNLDSFARGDTRILVCTEACGMGVDIQDIERIIQWRLTPLINLSVIWQRLGRCARGVNRTGIGIIMFQKSTVITNLHQPFFSRFQYAATDPCANQTLKEIRNWDTGKGVVPNINPPILRQRLEEEILLRGPDSDSDSENELLGETIPRAEWYQNKTPPEICRAILWFINTHKCMREVVLRYFDDPSWDNKPCQRFCSHCSDTTPFEVRHLIPVSGFPQPITYYEPPQQEKQCQLHARSKLPAPPVIFSQKGTEYLKRNLPGLRQHIWKELIGGSTYEIFGPDAAFSDIEMKTLISKAGRITSAQDVAHILSGSRPFNREKHSIIVMRVYNLISQALKHFGTVRPHPMTQVTELLQPPTSFLIENTLPPADTPDQTMDQARNQAILPCERDPFTDITTSGPSKNSVPSFFPSGKRRGRPPGSINKAHIAQTKGFLQSTVIPADAPDPMDQAILAHDPLTDITTSQTSNIKTSKISVTSFFPSGKRRGRPPGSMNKAPSKCRKVTKELFSHSNTKNLQPMQPGTTSQAGTISQPSTTSES